MNDEEPKIGPFQADFRFLNGRRSPETTGKNRKSVRYRLGQRIENALASFSGVRAPWLFFILHEHFHQNQQNR